MPDDFQFGELEEVHGVKVARTPVEFSPYAQISCAFCLAIEKLSWAKYIGQQPGQRPGFPEGVFTFWCNVCEGTTVLYRDELEEHENTILETAATFRNFINRVNESDPDCIQLFASRMKSLRRTNGNNS